MPSDGMATALAIASGTRGSSSRFDARMNVIVTAPANILRAAATLSWRLRLQPVDAGWVAMGLQAPLMSTERMADVFDPRTGPRVSTDHRTDGHWAWTDTVPYYLREHDLRPYIYRTDDYGKTWTKLTNGLPTVLAAAAMIALPHRSLEA